MTIMILIVAAVVVGAATIYFAVRSKEFCEGWEATFVFRLGYAEREAPRSPRRPLPDVIRIGDVRSGRAGHLTERLDKREGLTDLLAFLPEEEAEAAYG